MNQPNPETPSSPPAPSRPSLAAMLRGSVKWWAIPALVVVVLVLALVLLTETAASPFVYPLY